MYTVSISIKVKSPPLVVAFFTLDAYFVCATLLYKVVHGSNQELVFGMVYNQERST